MRILARERARGNARGRLRIGTMGLLAGAGLMTPHLARAADAGTSGVVGTTEPRTLAARLNARTVQPETATPLALTASRAGQIGVGTFSPFPIALRLGANVSPRTRFAAGVDVLLPRLPLLPGFQSRIDLDAIFSVNFGGVSTIVPLTFDQIYSHGLAGGIRVYGGGGIGPYFGDVTRFGGKLLVGADFTSRLGAEADVHFSGAGDALVTVQLRVGL